MTLSAKIMVGALGLVASTCSIGGYELLRSKDVRYHLTNSGESVLNVEKSYTSEATQEEDYQNWKAIIEKYKEPSQDIKSFIESEIDSKSEYEKINELKKKCKDILKTIKGHNNFETHLSNAKKFCIKQTNHQ